MTTFYLIRHGENDLVTHTIAGRSPGVHLNQKGRDQAELLATHLEHAGLRHIFCSPLERARETAEPLAQRLGFPVLLSEALNEMDFGEWTLKPFAELDKLETWRHWNTTRSVGRIPKGESMLEAQARMVAEMERLRRHFSGEAIALFGHGDPLRAALLYYLGMPLDFILRLQLSPASVSVLEVDDWTAQLHLFNRTFQG